MEIEKGKLYQSRNFPNITRKVVGVSNSGVVTYKFLNSNLGPAFVRVLKMVGSEFIKCSTGEVQTQ